MVTSRAVVLVWMAISIPRTSDAFQPPPTQTLPIGSSTSSLKPSKTQRIHILESPSSSLSPSNRVHAIPSSSSIRHSKALFLHPTAGAAAALAGSSLIGMQVSRWIPSGGILGTLLAASMAGNGLRTWVPTTHTLYDWCFTVFLPASLTLLLLAYQPPASVQDNDNGIGKSTSSDEDDATTTEDNSIASCIRRVAAPFVIASLSSLLGCWLSYRAAGIWGWFRIIGNTSSENLERARTATACLSASYVGGSVNCMATARLVGIPTDLLGSLVTADLFTMAIYFSFLSSSLDWNWMRSIFQPGSSSSSQSEQQQQGSSTTSTTMLPKKESIDNKKVFNNVTFQSKLLSSIPLLLGTFAIVQLANCVEDLVGTVVPGTACAVLSVVAPLINAQVNAKEWWRPFSTAAASWSDFFFLSFFASIGIAANLSSALEMGPACLLFSALALTVHVLGTLAGCALWKRIRKRSTIELEDVWIASNAAIGGPATAAAFCSRMTKNPGKLQGRTISATVWGVVGYAIGTVLGVGMYRLVGGGAL